MTGMLVGSLPFDAAKIYEKHRKEMGVDLARAFDKVNESALREQSPKGKEVVCPGAWVQSARDIFTSHTVNTSDRTFHVSTRASILSSQTEERPTGSDLAIYFEVRGIPPHPYELVKSKTLLVQAKSGERSGRLLEFGDTRLRGQMDAISAVAGEGGYLLIFTPDGAYCVTVQEAFGSIKGNQVKTSKWQASSVVFRNLASCTIGNCKEISPQSLGVSRRHLGEIDLDDANQRLAAFAESKRPRATSSVFSPSQALAISLEIRS